MTSTTTPRGERAARYERCTAAPMTALALLFLVVYATSVLWRDRSPAADGLLGLAGAAI